MSDNTDNSDSTQASTANREDQASASTPPPVPPYLEGDDPTNRGALADTQPQVRPGITNRTLRANGITTTDDLGANGTWGLKIPYYSYEGGYGGRFAVCDESQPESEFYRERLGRPRDDQKYSQPAGTRPHIYFPVGLAELLSSDAPLVVVEGEFKALSLVEAGFAAIGIGGIYNFQHQGVLLPDLVEFFDELARFRTVSEAIYFLGDTDTALNHAFAGAAVRMWHLLADAHLDYPLRLPRMPMRDLEIANGIDEARQAMSPTEFAEYMVRLLAEAVDLDERPDAEELTALLFEREEVVIRELIAAAPEKKRPWFFRRLAGLASHVAGHVADEIFEFAKVCGLVTKRSHFKAEQQKQKVKLDRELAAKNRANRKDTPVYYAPAAKNKYLYETASGEFTRVDRVGALNHLSNRGYSRKAGEGSALSEAVPFFLGWLSGAARNLHLDGGRFSPNQALVLAGEIAVGKNLIQEIITKVLGDRQADPFANMEGSSSFNGELVEVEHWMVADQQTSVKHADRERIKSAIKQACVNRSMRINAKFGKPINIEFFRRLTISLNDEPECLRVLPNLTSDFEDKLMILHVLPGLPFGSGTNYPGYKEWWTQVVSELPAFLHYLLTEHEIVPAHQDLRYGIQSYKDPETLRKITAQSPEARLLEIVDHAIFGERTTMWMGTAHDLYHELFRPSTAKELEVIGCNGATKAGQLLCKVMQLMPDRFQSSTLVQGTKRYRILPPQAICPVAANEDASTEEDIPHAA